MRRHSQVWVGFARGRSLVSLGVYVLSVVVAAWWAQLDLVGSPIFQGRATIVLAWASCLPALVALGALTSPNVELERSYPQRTVGLYRAAWLLVLAVVAPAGYAVVALARGESAWTVLWFARNHALLLGLGALTMLRMPSITGWVLPTAYVIACWFIGTVDGSGTAAVWALPNYLPDVAWVSVVAGAVMAAALVGHYRTPAAATLRD